MDGKIGRTNIVPDIRPENIDTYTETNTQEDGMEQSAEYKIVDAHPIIGGVLDKLAFFRTHASAVWYNKMKNITVLQKLDNLASNIGILTQLATTDKTSLVAAVNELNEKMAEVSVLTGQITISVGGTDTNFSKNTSGGTINFDKQFKNVPSVTVWTDSSTPSDNMVWICSVTKTSFRYGIYRYGNRTDMPVYWKAVGKMK